jgi:hypothetical protein
MDSFTSTNTPPDYKYWAFISYEHRDEAWAAWLHKSLEHYHVPRSLRGRESPTGHIPKRLCPIFRDKEELPATSNLPFKIQEALKLSRWLIVVCSQTSAVSPWVNMEIEVFRNLGKQNRILCIIVDGEPYASRRLNSPQLECFAPALLARINTTIDGKVEPLAVDVRPGKDSKNNAKLRIIAGILDIGFDDLILREKARNRNRIILNVSVGAIMSLIIAIVYIMLADEGSNIRGAERIRIMLDRYELSRFRPVASNEQVDNIAANLRGPLVEKLVSELQSGHWKSQQLRRSRDGSIDVWTSAQAISALLKAPNLAEPETIECMKFLEQAFSHDMLIETNGNHYGWIPAHASFTQVEPAFWMISAVSIGLGKSSLLTAETRKNWLVRLQYTQSITSQYYGGSGDWYSVCGTQRPSSPSTYASTLALLALLEAHSNGLPWEGSNQRRDDLLQATHAWLVANFHAECQPPGWFATPKSAIKDSIDGLTLQIFSLLLRAEKEVGIPLPETMRQALVSYLLSLESRPIVYPNVTIRPAVEFRDYLDQPHSEVIAIRFLWRPWAVYTASQWLDSPHSEQYASEVKVQIRRVLGNLLQNQADEKTNTLKWSTYVIAENLYCLSLVHHSQK